MVELVSRPLPYSNPSIETCMSSSERALQAELQVTVVPEEVAEMEAAVRVREVELRAREARLLPLSGAVGPAQGVGMTLAEQRQSVRASPCIHACPQCHGHLRATVSTLGCSRWWLLADWTVRSLVLVLAVALTVLDHPGAPRESVRRNTLDRYWPGRRKSGRPSIWHNH